MARHRGVRTTNYDDLEDDDYCGSLDEDYAISPNTAAQYLYNRDGPQKQFFPEKSFGLTDDDFPDQPEDDAASPSASQNLQSSANRVINRTSEISMPSSASRRPLQQPPANKKSTPPWSKDPNHHDDDSASGGHFALDMETENEELATLHLSSAMLPPPSIRPTESPTFNTRLGVPTAIPSHLEVCTEPSSRPGGVSGSASPRCASPNLPRSGGSSAALNAMAAAASQAMDRSHLVEAYRERCAERKGKETFNLIVIGHVDAGKSTLMGNLLCQVGCVSERQMQKYRYEAQKLGKSSFAYAWVLDQTGEERNRGITMDIAQTAFETTHKRVVLLDAPGHKDFIPNMISGAVQADAAVLVVNATRGEFETGFEDGGQTREHTLLVRSLGISQVLIAVNKMDTVDWDEERYNGICHRLSSFLRTVGMTGSAVVFCPVSGLSGINLMKRPQSGEEGDALIKWYSGPSLLDCIDQMTVPQRSVIEPFRFSISDIFKAVGSSSQSVSGRVEAGGIASLLATSAPAGLKKVVCMPGAIPAQVKSISITRIAADGDDTSGSDDQVMVPYAFAGDYATILLTGGIDVSTVLSQGSILCDPAHIIPCTNRVQAKLLLFNVTIPITKGFQVLFHFQSLNIMATFGRLLSFSYKDGKHETSKKNPRCLHKNGSAEVVIVLERPVCIELYSDFRSLGKFTLRAGGQTLAGGTVTAILSSRN